MAGLPCQKEVRKGGGDDDDGDGDIDDGDVYSTLYGAGTFGEWFKRR
jgi:hypothetical protein